MKILILDDMSIRHKAFKQNLIGHVVKCVETVKETIDSLNEETWDYLFLDHDLGGDVMVPSGPGTGYEVAQWLNKNVDKQPANIVIHSFNPDGAKNMASLLPKALICPGAWNKLITK